MQQRAGCTTVPNTLHQRQVILLAVDTSCSLGELLEQGVSFYTGHTALDAVSMSILNALVFSCIATMTIK